MIENLDQSILECAKERDGVIKDQELIRAVIDKVVKADAWEDAVIEAANAYAGLVAMGKVDQFHEVLEHGIQSFVRDLKFQMNLKACFLVKD